MVRIATALLRFKLLYRVKKVGIFYKFGIRIHKLVSVFYTKGNETYVNLKS